MKDFKGKVAVITGGASGIGLAIATRFGREGCRIVLADIEERALQVAVDMLRDHGIAAEGHRTDVANYTSVEGLRDHVNSTFGHTDLLFNNAGVSITGPTWKMSPDDWRWVWDVNVWGAVNGIRAFLPDMIERGEGGHVINTGSLASFNGNGDHAPYCSSKAALLGMSQSLYSEMAAMMTGIDVSILCPGMVATRINRSWRNRPGADTAWSDREYADEAFQQGSDEFQSRGLSAEQIAEATFKGVRDGSFYIFAGTTWQAFMEATMGRAMRAENPLVMTWGEDRRPLDERAALAWHSIAGTVE